MKSCLLKTSKGKNLLNFFPVCIFFVAGCAYNGPLDAVVAQCTTPITKDRPGPALVGQNYGMALVPLPLNSVTFASVDVARSLAVQNIYASRTPVRTVNVSARLVSCVDTPTSVAMRISFLKADTSPAEPPSAWKSVYLEPRATALYSENSLTSDTSNYLIEIKK